MMLRSWRKLRNDETGATAVEYGLIAGLISVVVIGALNTANSTITNVFSHISSSIGNALL